MEWHRIQTSSPETTIAIQAYNNQIQLTMTTPGAQGYLHLQSDRGGYHLLLSGLIIGLQSIITLGIHHTSVHIQTNLSTKALSRALKDKGDNHRTSYHEYFPLKTEIQTLRDKYDITISKFSQVTSPKQKSEPSPLYYNNTTMVSLRYNGRPTHKYRMYLQTLPCAEEYKTYMITKYNLGPVWEKIDWFNFFEAMKKYDNKGATISKFLHGWLSTGSNHQRYGKFKRKQCPFCDQAETTAHLYQCQEIQQKKMISTELDDLWTKAKEHLDPQLIHQLSICTDKWRSQPQNDDLPEHYQ